MTKVLTLLSIEDPGRLRAHWGRLIKAISRADASTAIKRNTLRLMQFVPIPPRYQGAIIDICFSLLSSRSETIAVKVFAMTVAEIVTGDMPELRRELKIMLEDQAVFAGPAFRSRSAKVLKALVNSGVHHGR